jgi:hypothetical protein
VKLKKNQRKGIDSRALPHDSDLDSGHHALEAAEVNMGTLVQGVENLIGVLLYLVLDVHLATLLVEGALAGKSVVKANLVRVGAQVGLKLLIVKERILVGNSEEQPCETLEVLAGRSALCAEEMIRYVEE